MPSIPIPRLLIALAALASPLFAAPPASSEADAENKIKTAWQNTSLGLFNDANRQFSELPGDEARLGEAVTLLLRQPKTDGNVSRSSELLSNIIKSSPDSPLAITARYYLGRIAQVHRSPADPDTARTLFRELIAAHPGHPYADLATVKLAVIELYEQVPDDTRRARFDEFAALSGKLKSDPARRDLNLLLADTSQRFGYDPAQTLVFLVAADRIGIVRRIEQGNAWVRIGQLAQDTGQVELAREYYNKYLATFIRDNRRRMVNERLAALPPATTPAKEAKK